MGYESAAWHIAGMEDLPVLQKCALNNGFLANNYSAVNTILYSQKYKALISLTGEWFFEKYCDDENTLAFSFPHNINGNKENLKTTLDELIHTQTGESEKNNIVAFKNITAAEKDFLSLHFEINKIEPTPAYSDYIYLTENLSKLPGSTYSKKRNHINQFKKKHPDFSFELLDSHNISIVSEIEEKWLLENTDSINSVQNNSSSGSDIDLQQERDIITNALNNFKAFSSEAQMRGGILFVKNQPVAFCLSSLLSPLVTDIHFEKCLSDFAKDGGYAVINNEYAKTISTKYINREEDLGIEGLRKAKRSYYPETILEKFDVEIKVAK